MLKASVSLLPGPSLKWDGGMEATGKRCPYRRFPRRRRSDWPRELELSRL